MLCVGNALPLPFRTATVKPYAHKTNPSKADNCTYYEVAKDGIAVIVNKENTFDNISLEDLKNIYNVEAGDAAIKTWAGVTK